MQQFTEIVFCCEPTITNAIGFIDSVSFTLECTDEQITQNSFSCSYSCDTIVNNIFAYSPDGKVFSVPSISLKVKQMVP